MPQSLVPALAKEEVVVMDNASFHKGTDMIEALKHAGAVLEFLPADSRDNPIEKKRAQAKAMRKRERSRVDALFAEDINDDKL